MLILDVRTLFIVTAIISFYTSLLLFLYFRNQKTYPGFGLWLAGNIVALVMYLLFALRGIAPDFLSVVIANSASALAHVLRLEGMKKFIKNSNLWLPNFTLPALVFIANYYFLYVTDSVQIRNLIFSAITIIIAARMAWLLIFEAGEDTKPISTFFAALLIVVCMGLVIRVFLYNLDETPNLLENSTVNSTSTLFLLIFDISWSVCLILMNSLRMNSEISKLTVQLEELASTDPLTGLYNRRKFLEIGEAELERAHRYKRSLSLIMFDLNNFKDVNDTYGHAEGDATLKKVVAACKKHLRQQDTLGRFGGDEFVALLPETSLPEAEAIARRLNQEVLSIQHPENYHINISISYGISTLTPADENLDHLIQRADVLLYAMKAQKDTPPRSIESLS